MNKTQTGLLLLLVTFISLALAWNISIPAYENLDEMEHVEVIRHIAVTEKLPIHGEAEVAGFHVRQEASQPPLYHLLGAAWVRAWNLPLEAPTATAIPGTFVACGSGDTTYNRVTWSRNPYLEFPGQGHRRTTHSLRLLSTLLQCVTIGGTWMLARRISLRSSARLLAVAIVALNPQFLLVAAGVNNDNLVTPLATWALVLLLDIWKRGPTPPRLLGLGILTGLAALSKLSGIGLLGLAGITLLVYTWQKRPPFKQLLVWGLLTGTPTLLLVTPWLIWNWRIYGDPTALTPMLEIVGRTTTRVDFWGSFQLMLRSYWGQLPCAFYPRALYWHFFILLGGGLLGLLLQSRRGFVTQAEQLILGGWFAIIVIAWIRWNALTPATGGRLLFPAAPALAILLAIGWQTLHRNLVRTWSVVLPLGALLTLLAGAIPLFTPPPRLSANTAMTATSNITFGAGDIALESYEVNLVKPGLACWLVQSSYCRPALELTLYLKAPHPLSQDLGLAVQLVSARPGDNTLRLAYNAWPGHGNLPTSALPAGQLFREHLLLPLPESEYPTQAWKLQVAFFDEKTNLRLPVAIDGEPVGDAAVLETLRVPGGQNPCADLPPLETPVLFNEAIALTHAVAEPGASGWEVQLCWENLAMVDVDYTVFVHAYATDGTLLGTGDGPPMAQAFPSQLWQPGDRILDIHALEAEQTPANIAVGLYHPQTGVRLEAFSGTERQPNDAVIIWSP
ncbi:MAG: glycosyltransferase family 39 protein [Anaerolineae bacterium]|nr:glycosyltransferase family 39 protein [Anaerolineae bacterium]